MSNIDFHINGCKSFAQRINARKDYPRNIEKIKKISLAISEIFQLNEERRRIIEWAAELMDIGEIIVKENVLNKNSILTSDEWEKIKEHSKETVVILTDNSPCFCDRNDAYTDLLKIIRSIHERYDGKGYPDGIKHKNIPLESQILSFALAYVVMTSHTEYRGPRRDTEIKAEIRNNILAQFCPHVVAIGLTVIKNIN